LGRVSEDGPAPVDSDSDRLDLPRLDTLPDGLRAPAADDEEDESATLATGAWRVLGSGLDADVVVKDTRLSSRGVRLRRVGEGVELVPTASGVQITVDGESYSGGVVSLKDQDVEVDGVPLRDDYLPHDTMDAGDLPDFMAPILIGRGADCDYVIPDELVSSHHAGLSRQDGFLLLEDLDSANGTYVDDRRIKRMRISWRQEFEVGGYRLTALEVFATTRGESFSGQTAMFSAKTAMNLAKVLGSDTGDVDIGTFGGGSAVSSPLLKLKAGETAIVGRDPDVEVVYDTPNVSRKHAQLRRTSKGMVVEDLGSTNGTWVNGDRIRKPTEIAPGDDVRFGHQKLQLTRGFAIELPLSGGGATGVRIDGEALVRMVGSGPGRRRVIDDLNFSILPGEMVALMGPSGAGKTSLLTTIAGYTPPSSGQIFMDGMSLYSHFGLFREAVGYVPQEDVMHRSLTVEEVLYYQAKLNFPAEVTRDEINDRIGLILAQLDLQDVRHSVVGDEVRRGLSGGQRKRLNVAMELMSEPAALLLDEPTSGLDARSAIQLIRQCRGLASSGRTVIMTIHQPRREAFDLFDKLLLLTKGG
jgi:ABC-type multidrug transport system ATPase subunit